MISEEVKTGEIQATLKAPLEDLYTGWEKSGQVGQEIYGSGASFAVVPRQYFNIDDSFLVFIDYPVSSHIKRQKSLFLKIEGNSEMKCNLTIIPLSGKKFNVEVFQNGELIHQGKKDFKLQKYRLLGEGKIKISWR